MSSIVPVTKKDPFTCLNQDVLTLVLGFLTPKDWSNIRLVSKNGLDVITNCASLALKNATRSYLTDVFAVDKENFEALFKRYSGTFIFNNLISNENQTVDKLKTLLTRIENPDNASCRPLHFVSNTRAIDCAILYKTIDPSAEENKTETFKKMSQEWIKQKKPEPALLMAESVCDETVKVKIFEMCIAHCLTDLKDNERALNVVKKVFVATQHILNASIKTDLLYLCFINFLQLEKLEMCSKVAEEALKLRTSLPDEGNKSNKKKLLEIIDMQNNMVAL